jgi:hypothetical protein
VNFIKADGVTLIPSFRLWQILHRPVRGYKDKQYSNSCFSSLQAGAAWGRKLKNSGGNKHLSKIIAKLKVRLSNNVSKKANNA